MKKTAAVAALVLAVAVSGCSTASIQRAQPAQPQPSPVVAQQAEPETVYEFVRENWVGNDVPSEGWIENAATLACKRIIGNITDAPVYYETTGRYAAKNNEIIYSAARQIMGCRKG